MARPKSFDETQAVRAATRLFWSAGYEATSVRELADVMGIGQASFYNAFGDKRQLFERALLHYVGDTFNLESGDLPPRAAISGFFARVIDFSIKDEDKKGCLVVNTAVEMASHGGAVATLLTGVLDRVETFFRHHIERGQETGDIAADHSPTELARHLLGILLGLRVLARVKPERSYLESVVAPGLALLHPGTNPG
jgi:TetR/AcrR family transcriptional repressor of nem operon